MTQIFAGTGYGQIFNINLLLPKSKQVINKIGSLKKQRILSIDLLNENENIYFCSQKNIYKSYFNNTIKQQIYSYKYSNQKLIGLYGSINGNNNNQNNIQIYHAFNDGSIAYLKKDQNSTQQQQEIFISKQILKGKFQPNQKKAYQRFLYDAKNNKYCLIGKQVLPFLYDAQKGLITWTGKNVPNDQLDLHVQVNDVDGTFYKNGQHLACAHKNNRIRIYDIRSNKQKPSADYGLSLDKIYNKSYLTKIIVEKSGQNLFYIANDVGAVYECDIRKSMHVIGKFKGITTTITDMQIQGENLYVSSLDSNVRSFDLQNKSLIQKYYMNKPIYSIFIKKSLAKQLEQFQQEVLSQEQDILGQTQKESKKMKKLRKRNKVNLKYLKQVNWDQVPIDPELLKQAKQQYEEINQKDRDGYEDEQENKIKIKDEHLSEEEEGRDSDLD